MKALKYIGLFSLASTLFYAVTGVAWWASTDNDTGRGTLIYLLHYCGLAAGLYYMIFKKPEA